MMLRNVTKWKIRNISYPEITLLLIIICSGPSFEITCHECVCENCIPSEHPYCHNPTHKTVENSNKTGKCYTASWDVNRNGSWMKVIKRSNKSGQNLECQGYRHSDMYKNVICNECSNGDFCNKKPVKPIRYCYQCECDECENLKDKCLSKVAVEIPGEFCVSVSWKMNGSLFVRKNVTRNVNDCLEKQQEMILFQEFICDMCDGNLCNGATTAPISCANPVKKKFSVSLGDNCILFAIVTLSRKIIVNCKTSGQEFCHELESKLVSILPEFSFVVCDQTLCSKFLDKLKEIFQIFVNTPQDGPENMTEQSENSDNWRALTWTLEYPLLDKTTTNSHEKKIRNLRTLLGRAHQSRRQHRKSTKASIKLTTDSTYHPMILNDHQSEESIRKEEEKIPTANIHPKTTPVFLNFSLQILLNSQTDTKQHHQTQSKIENQPRISRMKSTSDHLVWQESTTTSNWPTKSVYLNVQATWKQPSKKENEEDEEEDDVSKTTSKVTRMENNDDTKSFHFDSEESIEDDLTTRHQNVHHFLPTFPSLQPKDESSEEESSETNQETTGRLVWTTKRSTENYPSKPKEDMLTGPVLTLIQPSKTIIPTDQIKSTTKLTSVNIWNATRRTAFAWSDEESEES